MEGRLLRKRLGQSRNDAQLWVRLVVKLQCCKEQHRLGAWNVRSTRGGCGQAGDGREDTDVLGISELKWTRIGEFNSDDHSIYYCRQESLRRNGIAIIVNKRVQMQYLDAISNMTE